MAEPLGGGQNPILQQQAGVFAPVVAPDHAVQFPVNIHVGGDSSVINTRIIGAGPSWGVAPQVLAAHPALGVIGGVPGLGIVEHQYVLPSNAHASAMELYNTMVACFANTANILHFGPGHRIQTYLEMHQWTEDRAHNRRMFNYRVGGGVLVPWQNYTFQHIFESLDQALGSEPGLFIHAMRIIVVIPPDGGCDWGTGEKMTGDITHISNIDFGCGWYAVYLAKWWAENLHPSALLGKTAEEVKVVKKDWGIMKRIKATKTGYSKPPYVAPGRNLARAAGIHLEVNNTDPRTGRTCASTKTFCHTAMNVDDIGTIAEYINNQLLEEKKEWRIRIGVWSKQEYACVYMSPSPFKSRRLIESVMRECSSMDFEQTLEYLNETDFIRASEEAGESKLTRSVFDEYQREKKEERFVWLLISKMSEDRRHFDFIAKIKGLQRTTGRHSAKWCDMCMAIRGDRHRCIFKCVACFSPLCPGKEAMMGAHTQCRDCRRMFFNDLCYESHKKPQRNGEPTTCEKVWQCRPLMVPDAFENFADDEDGYCRRRENNMNSYTLYSDRRFTKTGFIRPWQADSIFEHQWDDWKTEADSDERGAYTDGIHVHDVTYCSKCKQCQPEGHSHYIERLVGKNDSVKLCDQYTFDTETNTLSEEEECPKAMSMAGDQVLSSLSLVRLDADLSDPGADGRLKQVFDDEHSAFSYLFNQMHIDRKQENDERKREHKMKHVQGEPVLLSTSKIYLIIHYGKKFDNMHILKFLLKNKDCPYTCAPPIQRGTALMGMTLVPKQKFAHYPHIVIRDSGCHWGTSLDRAAKMFGVPQRKLFFPYEMLQNKNMGYVGNVPPAKLYNLSRMNKEDVDDFCKWYNGAQLWFNKKAADCVFVGDQKKLSLPENKNWVTLNEMKATTPHCDNIFFTEPWNFRRELNTYCISDTILLAKVWLKYRTMLMTDPMLQLKGGEDPIKYLTIAAMCRAIWRRHFMIKGLLSPTYDREMDDWLRKALRGGRTEVFANLYKVDGQASPTNRIGKLDYVSLYPSQQISQLYPIHHGETLIEPNVDATLEIILDEKCRGVYEIDGYYARFNLIPVLPAYQNGKLKCSLSPVEHGHFFSEELRIAISEQYFVITKIHKAQIWRPQHLSNAVFRDYMKWGYNMKYTNDGKIAILEKQLLVIYHQHESVLTEKHAAEIKAGFAAISKAKKHPWGETHGVADLCQLYPDIGRLCTLFTDKSDVKDYDNVNTILQLSVKANNDSFNGDMNLDTTPLSPNPGKVALAKLMINSLWGITAMSLAKRSVTVFFDQTQRAEFYNSISDSDFKYTINIISDTHVQVKYAVKQRRNIDDMGNTIKKTGYTKKLWNASPETDNISTPVGIFTTGYGRVKLFRAMSSVGFHNMLYCDTDSVMYVHDAESKPTIGSAIGMLLPETKPMAYLSHFASLAPKTYSIYGDGSSVTKAKGVTLKDLDKKDLDNIFTEQQVTHDILAQEVLNQKSIKTLVEQFRDHGITTQRLEVPQLQFQCDVERAYTLVKRRLTKNIGLTLDKRVIYSSDKGNLFSLPIGWEQYTEDSLEEATQLPTAKRRLVVPIAGK